MKITIIGYKNHSVRLHNLLNILGYESTMWNHHEDNFSKVIGSDCIFVSSPADTHVENIKRILK